MQWIEPILARLQRDCTLLRGWRPNQVHINDYRRSRGHSIAAHMDDRALSGEKLVMLSLLSDCVMTLEPLYVSQRPVRSHLTRRSLQVMEKEARYRWCVCCVLCDVMCVVRCVCAR